MTLFKFIIKSIVHYRKQHLALLAGTAIGAAVLTGALIVGDSVSYSLRKMVDTRLGKTKYAVVGGSRFFRSDLAKELSSTLHAPATPVLLLQGIATHSESEERISKASIVGIDSTFWYFSEKGLPTPGDDEALISENVAEKLNLKVDDEIVLRVESAGLIPVNAPFAKEPKPSVSMRLTIAGIATDQHLGKLNLSNNQSNPFNIFISQGYLSKKLDLANMANVILIAGSADHAFTTEAVKASVKSSWKMEDMGLSFKENKFPGGYDLVSNRVFIDEVVSKTVAQSRFSHVNVITYLVNSMRLGDKETPYSFATAATASLIGDSLENNEVIINKWLQTDLNAGIGDSIWLRYYEIGPLRELKETDRPFIVKSIIENTGNGIDNSLMPSFQGLSDAGNCRDWDAGVPIDMKKIRDKDEKYWDDYKGTPKILLSLETGKKLWSNQFGTLTAIRFSKNQVLPDSMEHLLLTHIDPAEFGLRIVATHGEGVNAANNSVNFTELFLSLSFFIIVAAILLIMLIFSLHTDKRSEETAILCGLGFQRKTIFYVRFLEPALVILAGSIVGAFLGIYYNHALVYGLNSVWNDVIRANMLEVHVKASTLAIGAISSVVLTLIPIFLVTRRKLRQPVAEGVKAAPPSIANVSQKKIGTGAVLQYLAWGGALVVLTFSVLTAAYENAGLYLSSAALFMAGSIMACYNFMGKSNTREKQVYGIFRLAIKNLQRNKSRSITVIAILAIGTFTLILTGAYRKTFYGSENLRSSGTGGYVLWAATTSPVPYNLNIPSGKTNLNVSGKNDLDSVRFLQFQGLEGDDASCLNLNQAQRPGILAVNASAFDAANAFSFAKLLSVIPKEHPWLAIDKPLGENIYPAFADQNVIQYGLKMSIGDTLVYADEKGDTFKLILIGGLNNSVFQGYILISDSVFRRHFPSSGGSKVMLVDAPAAKQTIISDILEQSLTDYGIEVTPTSKRLATFNSVENTYLSVFMALSGLGFIIGTFGLGIILLRNINERKQELALLLSIGFNRKLVFRLVYTENLILLATGMWIGIFAALVGILPSLLSPSFNIQGTFLTLLIVLIFTSGALWIYFPLKVALKRSLIQALRKE